MSNLINNPAESTAKKRRNLPGNPDPDAEVIALSPKSLMATNRFMCEVCNKGFQRDQNLQLHRRGHNLPWKLKQRPSKELIKKKVYICPEASCVHHSPSRALGDLTGIKKHFSRKHGEKRYRCDKCSKKYAVHSDWKAHSKTCGTREYRCDCGTIFSRRDSFVTHRAFCDALTEESAKAVRLPPNPVSHSSDPQHPLLAFHHQPDQFLGGHDHQIWAHDLGPLIQTAAAVPPPAAHLSATALLQKAAEMGATLSSCRPALSGYITTQMAPHDTSCSAPLLQEMLMMSAPGISAADDVSSSSNNAMLGKIEEGQELTRDFLGLKALSHKDMIFSMAGLQGLDHPCMKLRDI